MSCCPHHRPMAQPPPTLHPLRQHQPLLHPDGHRLRRRDDRARRERGQDAEGLPVAGDPGHLQPVRTDADVSRSVCAWGGTRSPARNASRSGSGGCAACSGRSARACHHRGQRADLARGRASPSTFTAHTPTSATAGHWRARAVVVLQHCHADSRAVTDTGSGTSLPAASTHTSSTWPVTRSSSPRYTSCWNTSR